MLASIFGAYLGHIRNSMLKPIEGRSLMAFSAVISMLKSSDTLRFGLVKKV